MEETKLIFGEKLLPTIQRGVDIFFDIVPPNSKLETVETLDPIDKPHIEFERIFFSIIHFWPDEVRSAAVINVLRVRKMNE